MCQDIGLTQITGCCQAIAPACYVIAIAGFIDRYGRHVLAFEPAVGFSPLIGEKNLPETREDIPRIEATFAFILPDRILDNLIQCNVLQTQELALRSVG